MGATFVTDDLATISAALRPCMVVLAATGKPYGSSSSACVSWSVVGLGAMKTILCSLATTDPAGPSAEVRVPTRNSSFSLRISSRATRAASLASALESRTTSSSLRPRTPPLAFVSSTNICAPLLAGSPKRAGGPDRGMGMPTLMAFCAWAGKGATSTTTARAIKRIRRCMSISFSAGDGMAGIVAQATLAVIGLEHRPAGDSHPQPVERGGGRDEQGAIIIVAPREVGRVLWHLDDVERRPVGSEDVDPPGAAAVDVPGAIDLHPIGRARLVALGLRPDPAVAEDPGGRDRKGPDVLARGVVDEETRLVQREAETVGRLEVVNQKVR